MEIELVKEKTNEEMMNEGGGYIRVGFNVMDGTIAENGEKFDVMVSGSELFFNFEKGKRRVSMDLTAAISKAYVLSRT